MPPQRRRVCAMPLHSDDCAIGNAPNLGARLVPMLQALNFIHLRKGLTPFVIYSRNANRHGDPEVPMIAQRCLKPRVYTVLKHSDQCMHAGAHLELVQHAVHAAQRLRAQRAQRSGRDALRHAQQLRRWRR